MHLLVTYLRNLYLIDTYPIDTYIRSEKLFQLQIILFIYFVHLTKFLDLKYVSLRYERIKTPAVIFYLEHKIKLASYSSNKKMLSLKESTLSKLKILTQVSSGYPKPVDAFSDLTELAKLSLSPLSLPGPLL